MFWAGLAAPRTRRVTETRVEAPGARLPAPVRSFQRRLPLPTPSGAGVAETNSKKEPLKVSSRGREVMAVSPVFWTVMEKTTLSPLLAGPGLGETRDLVTEREGLVMMMFSVSDAVRPPPALARTLLTAGLAEASAVKLTMMSRL